MQFRPNDFRRMFATEAVTGGLPVHIAAKVLGHASLQTTQHYLAVFPHEMIRSYRAYLDKRRSIRPEAEYREPTQEEWAEFRQHFHERKLELGSCGRPYGTPCQHEHACVRCPMLRMDPRQRGRLVEIIRNLEDRIGEARLNGWSVKYRACRRAVTQQPRSSLPSIAQSPKPARAPPTQPTLGSRPPPQHDECPRFRLDSRGDNGESVPRVIKDAVITYPTLRRCRDGPCRDRHRTAGPFWKDPDSITPTASARPDRCIS